MTNTKLEQLTKAIQEANPDIMKLEMGCKIYVCNKNLKNSVHLYCGKYMDRRGNSLALINDGDFLPMNLDDIKKEKYGIKILGRDITLEDCLSASRKREIGTFAKCKKCGRKYKNPDQNLWIAGHYRCIDLNSDKKSCSGYMEHWEVKPIDCDFYSKLLDFWTMGKPLHQQGQETIDFLWDLICK